MKSLLFIFSTFFVCVSSYKFLAYSPQFANSHVNFMAKISDTLVEAGHDVVLLSPVMDLNVRGPGTRKPRVIEIEQDDRGKEFEREMNSDIGRTAWLLQNSYEIFSKWAKTYDMWAEQCNATIYHPGLLQQLKEEKFDVGFAESIDYCAVGLFHLLGIEKYAMTESIAIKDGLFVLTQTASIPSYVPTILGGSFGEDLTFFERCFNTFNFLYLRRYNYLPFPIYQRMFEKNWPGFPDLIGLMSNASLIFLNSDPLVDFPKPSSSRIIDIGGISVHDGYKPLNETWSKMLDLRPQTVLISFGTFAKAHLMPESYKETIRKTVKKFPNVTFIWKYEKPEDNVSEGIPNLIESTWIPQHDMLHDPRLSAFITHCGQGSTTEANTAGVPLVVIPVAFDQVRNAYQVKRNGVGVIMDKTELGKVGKLEEAIKEILSNPKYQQRAKKIQQMLEDRPFNMKDTFVRHMEFLAKHGPLRQLDHYGRHLNFFQYYLIDVAAFAFGLLSLAIISVLFIVKVLISQLPISIRKVKQN